MSQTYDGETGRRALLATHIDPAWGTPEVFQENVEQYIAEEDYDDFVCISHPYRSDAAFDDRADYVIHSDDGGLEQDEVEPLLDAYDAFTHIGAFWGRCHYQTFKSLTDEMEVRTGCRYAIDVPLDAVVEREGEQLSDVVLPVDDGFGAVFDEFVQDLADRVYREDSELLPWSKDRVGEFRDEGRFPYLFQSPEHEVLESMILYQAALDDALHHEDVVFGFDTDDGVLSWTFTPRKHYGDMIDRFLAEGGYHG